MRSASLAPIACLKLTVPRRWTPGRVQVDLRERHLQRLRQRERAVGQAARVRVAQGRVARVEITVAVVDAVYSRATPGVNAPNVAGAPSVSASVAGTVPPTPPETGVPTVTTTRW